MFTAEHFIWIGLCAGAVAGLCALSVQKKLSLKTAGGIIMAICALSEVSKVLSNMVESPEGGMHLDPHSLPLHLCSLMIFVVLYITFGKEGSLKRVLMNFLAVAGDAGQPLRHLDPDQRHGFCVASGLSVLCLSRRIDVVFHLSDPVGEGEAGQFPRAGGKHGAIDAGGVFDAVCQRRALRL